MLYYFRLFGRPLWLLRSRGLSERFSFMRILLLGWNFRLTFSFIFISVYDIINYDRDNVCYIVNIGIKNKAFSLIYLFCQTFISPQMQPSQKCFAYCFSNCNFFLFTFIQCLIKPLFILLCYFIYNLHTLVGGSCSIVPHRLIKNLLISSVFYLLIKMVIAIRISSTASPLP